MMKRSFFDCVPHRALLALAAALAALGAHAQMAPRTSSAFQDRVLAPAGFVATVAPQELSEVQAELDPATLADIARFRTEQGRNWRFYVDRRSGGMALVEGAGIPWIPGRGNRLDPEGVRGSGPDGSFTVDDLAAKALAFIEHHPSLFQVSSSQLVLDRSGSLNLGDTNQIWTIAFQQMLDGIPVEGARVFFRVSHGNLVQFGVDRTIGSQVPHDSSVPAFTAAAAKAAVEEYIGGVKVEDTLTGGGVLQWIPRGAADQVGYSGKIGAGWEPTLVYRYILERQGQIGTWRIDVDAHKGTVIRFVDDNDYAALLKGSVYTLSNCTDPLNCVPGSALETTITMPSARMSFAGGTCTGNACFTNSAGAFDYPAGSVASSTSLDGKYFRVIDECGAIAASGVAPGGIDLGTSDPNPPLNTNTDCAPANRESRPNSGTTFGGTGDTHSARNCFYHLNLINQKGRVYLPQNEWMKGADGTRGSALVHTNGPPACNALWQGTTGSLNFLKQTPGLQCNNTGEIPDVFLHEWGHGLDQNDGTGTAPESATGEAMGDTFALLQGQHSCIGPGLFLPNPLDVNWGNRAGYGTGSALCSGVRDLDYTRFCYHTTAPGCGVSLDPDAPNGSRSGAAPPPNPPETGTPARWNHMIAGSPAGVFNGQSNFYNCGGPEDTGCAGPLDHGCHCESMIASQSNWDLAKRLIAFEFGGDIYRVPQGPREVSGWQYMDRLWYLTRDLSVSAYSVTGVAPAGTTNGCAVSNWFSTYRFIDDDNGNLADGTPHAAIIFSAFDLHATACGSASDPSNQSGGCPAPVSAPVLSACDTKSPVQLNWTTSAGATKYRVLRNTLGCGFGFTPIATLASGQRYFEDDDVAPGVPYYYSVQPVGAGESCYGQTSNCITVTPSTCGATAAATPAGVTLATPSSNTVQVSWNTVSGAGSYKISRKEGTCAATTPYTAIGVVTAPTTSFLDSNGLQGCLTYSYQVASADTSCAACTSAPSVCKSVTPSGGCTLAPQFDGVDMVLAGAEGECKLTVKWSAGTPGCCSALTYSVYRSTSAGFTPSPANLVASGLTGTSFDDYTVTGGIRYYYLVRAVDGFGNTDSNSVRISETAVGVTTPGTFTDNAGDTSTAKFIPSPTLNNDWAIRPNDTGNATRVYATTATGDYRVNACQGLEGPTVFLGANPTLTFRSRYDMEQGWDGGYVEVSTETGGFSDWTKLTSVNYPGIMSGPLGDPACGGPGFADGQPVFTGTGGWSSFSGSLSAYANQRIRIRFLFGSDSSTVAAGWFLDDVQVTDARIPGSCLREVSGKDSGHPLRVFKRPDGNLRLVFEDLGATANSYNFYEGDIGIWYSHTGTLCHDTSSTPNVPAAGDRTLNSYVTSAPRAYFLISASNASSEGILGTDSGSNLIPPPAPQCGPNP